MTHLSDPMLPPEELSRIFVSLGLAAEHEVPKATPLTGGVSSGIYRIDVASGFYCLKQALPQLKVAKEWKVPVNRVFAEIAWLKAADQIVPGHVPKVLGEDEATKSFVMEYLATGHSVWKSALLNGQIDIDVARQVGSIIGKIHEKTAHSQSCKARFANDDNFYAIRLEPYLAETGRVHPALNARMLELIARTQKNGVALVHGDLSPKNILVGPNGPVILDAECALYGDPAFDVAFCLNHFLLKSAWMPVHLTALMGAFTAFYVSYFDTVGFEAQTGLEARIATLLPALTLARIDGKSPVEYLDEKTRDRVRTVAITLLEKNFVRLDDVATYWIREFTQ